MQNVNKTNAMIDYLKANKEYYEALIDHQEESGELEEITERSKVLQDLLNTLVKRFEEYNDIEISKMAKSFRRNAAELRE